MTLAAIDIGSNAARLLISEPKPFRDGSVDFVKLNLLRVPLRLGFDVFDTGVISPAKQQELVDTMRIYRDLMKLYKVERMKICATSAMRDAANREEVIARVKKETGLEIDVITGHQEASIIYETHIAETLVEGKNYLYIDVGGGSTEVTLFAKGQTIFKESFNIGTIRLLRGQVDEARWESLKWYLRTNVKEYQPLEAIGSGGNINKVFSISKRKEGRPLPLELLRDYHKEIGARTLEERRHLYGFRDDRADVIVPALQVFINIMRWSGAEEIYVPKIGLADGLVKVLYGEVNTLSHARI